MMMVQLGCTTLIFAAAKGHLDVIKYLVKDCGADVNVENAVRSNYICLYYDNTYTSYARAIVDVNTVYSQ